MRHLNLNYSFLTGVVVTLIGLMGVTGHWLGIHLLTSYRNTLGMDMALSTSVSLVFLGLGLATCMGSSHLKLIKLDSRKHQITILLLLIPTTIALYNILGYFFLARFILIHPFIRSYPQIPMAFLTALQLFIISVGMLIFNHYRQSRWAWNMLGIIGLFILETVIFSIVGYITKLPVLFSFMQTFPTVIALIAISSLFIRGTISNNGFLSTLASPLKKIRMLSLISIVSSSIILVIGIIIINLFQTFIAQGVTGISVEELYIGFEFTTITLSMLVLILSLRVAFFFESSLKAEQEIRQSEERFRQLVSAVKEYAIYMLDPEGKITTWNEGAERIQGYRAEEIIGKNYAIFYTDEEVKEGLPKQQLELTQKAGSHEVESWLVRKDGTSFWARCTITAIYSQDRVLMGFSKVIRDLTLQRQMEGSLRTSIDELSHLKSAIDASSIVAITDKEGIITYVNDAFCKISQYTREELLGKTHHLINSGYHTPEFFEDLWRTIGQGKIWKGEIHNRTKSGGSYWVDTTIYPFFSESSSPVRYIAIHHDITPLKTAQQELKLNAYRQRILSTLSQQALTGIEIDKLLQNASILTAKGLQVPLCRILELQPSGKELLLKAGYGWQEGFAGNALVPASADSQAGFTLLMENPVIVEDFRSEDRFSESWLLQTNQVVSGMSVTIRGESAEKPFGVLGIYTKTIHQFKLEDEMFLQAVANVIAIATERKHAETLLREFSQELEKHVTERTRQLEDAKREAEEANRLKTRVLAFVSHDFKNPLAAMEHFTQILEKANGELTKQQHEIISYIADGIAQLRAMVTDILDKARMEEGKLVLSLECVEIISLLEELKPIFQSLAIDKQIKIHYEIQPDLSGIEADPRFLRQILLNLMSNAIKYNKIAGDVTLRIKEIPKQQFICIEVQDTGIGIPQESIPELFKEYFRIGATTYDQVEGTGLGLAFTKKLIDMHGGQITVTSKVNKGSVFTVILPNYMPKPQQPVKSSSFLRPE